MAKKRELGWWTRRPTDVPLNSHEWSAHGQSQSGQSTLLDSPPGARIPSREGRFSIMDAITVAPWIQAQSYEC